MAKRKNEPPLSVPRYLRNFRGISMEALADELGVSFLTVFNMEHGQSISLGSLKKAASFFGMTLDSLARNDLTKAVSTLYSPAIRANHMKQVLREKQRQRDEIGDRGEQIVIQRERARLDGTPFAMAVNGNVSEDVTAGFDVLSFDEFGSPVYIEAKTTVGGENTPFYMSRRELEFATTCHESGDNYQLHRLYELDGTDNCKVKILSASDLLRDFEFLPVTYLVRRKAV